MTVKAAIWQLISYAGKYENPVRISGNTLIDYVRRHCTAQPGSTMRIFRDMRGDKGLTIKNTNRNKSMYEIEVS